GVIDAAFDGLGRRVVTAGEDHTARVWDADTGAPRTGPLPHGAPVLSAAFSPGDGRVVATAGVDAALRRGAATTSHLGRTWADATMRHNGKAWHAAFSPDGRFVVTASMDGTARVWDAETGAHLTSPLRHGTIALHAGFSPDGELVVTTSDDKTARIWDAATGT